MRHLLGFLQCRLALPEGIFCPPPLGDVPHDHLDDRDAGNVGHHASPLHPERDSIQPEELELGGWRRFAQEIHRSVLPDTVAGVGMNDLEEVPAEDLIRTGCAKKVHPGWIDVEDLLTVVDEYDVESGLHQGSVLGLALPQGFFGLLPLGDVGEALQNPDDFSGGILDGLGYNAEPAPTVRDVLLNSRDLAR